MITENSNAKDEGQIRQLIDDWAAALRAKDIKRLTSNYAPDILLFDVPPPLQSQGSDSYRKSWEARFSTFQGPIGCEIRQLSITAGDDVAFSHCLNRISGTTTNGEKIDLRVRATVCYRKIDGEWMVTHEHASVPVEMETGKAALNLEA